MLTIRDNEKIITIIKHLISSKKDIQILIAGEKTEFSSKIIKINQDDLASSISQRSAIIIDRLYPEKGNASIQSASKATMSFSISEKLCRCSITYLGISSDSPHFGFFLKIPESVEIEEKRDNERVSYAMPDFVSAEFTLGKGTKEEKVYELNVMDCSIRGLSLIITEDNFNLLERVKTETQIRDIKFFAPRSMIKVNGLVKHITKIEEGEYKGSYQIGIESDDIIDSCNPKEGQTTKA